MSEFARASATVDKLNVNCKKCNIKIANTEYYIKNKEKINNKSKEYHIQNRETILAGKKEYYYDNTLKINEYNKSYYVNNKESLTIKKNKYMQNNRGKLNALNTRRRISAKQRCPKWANNDKIKTYYLAAQVMNFFNPFANHHVDHIIPLNGKVVSGLHVENNIQILTAHENNVKSNKYIPE